MDYYNSVGYVVIVQFTPGKFNVPPNRPTPDKLSQRHEASTLDEIIAFVERLKETGVSNLEVLKLVEVIHRDVKYPDVVNSKPNSTDLYRK